MTAAAHALGVGPSLWENHIARLSHLVLQTIFLHYDLNADASADLRKETMSGIGKLYALAHDLSLIIKRDVLSVELTVVSSAGGTYHAQEAKAICDTDEMRTVEGDLVVGCYAFGLHKTTEDGDFPVVMFRPTLTTAALLRYVGS